MESGSDSVTQINDLTWITFLGDSIRLESRW